MLSKLSYAIIWFLVLMGVCLWLSFTFLDSTFLIPYFYGIFITATVLILLVFVLLILQKINNKQDSHYEKNINL